MGGLGHGRVRVNTYSLYKYENDEEKTDGGSNRKSWAYEQDLAIITILFKSAMIPHIFPKLLCLISLFSWPS